MAIAGYLCAMLVGISLGAMGMGGSILTIPIMVYMIHVSPMDATAYSLFVVGLTSAVGSANYIREKMVDLKTASVFSLPSIAAVFITRAFLMPLVPDPVIRISSFSLSKDLFILLLLALLMIIIAYNMIRNNKIEEPEEKKSGWNDYLWLVFIGLISGVLTGILGVGGGFIIIPSLVLLAKTPIKMSVGTSLLIIAVNSFIGFTGELIVRHEAIDYKFLFLFALLSVVGVFIGFRWTSKMVSTQQKKMFGWFVLIIGASIFIKEIFFR